MLHLRINPSVRTGFSDGTAGHAVLERCTWSLNCAVFSRRTRYQIVVSLSIRVPSAAVVTTAPVKGMRLLDKGIVYSLSVIDHGESGKVEKLHHAVHKLAVAASARLSEAASLVRRSSYHTPGVQAGVFVSGAEHIDEILFFSSFTARQRPRPSKFQFLSKVISHKMVLWGKFGLGLSPRFQATLYHCNRRSLSRICPDENWDEFEGNFRQENSFGSIFRGHNVVRLYTFTIPTAAWLFGAGTA